METQISTSRVLQRDTLEQHLLITRQDYVLRTSIYQIKENDFTPKRERNKPYPAETILDSDYSDDLPLLANTPAQAESKLHRLKTFAWDIGLHMNANKTEFKCFKR